MPFPLFLAFAALIAAFLFDRRRRVYADLGTTPAAAVYAGRNEVKGRAWHAEPLTSHMTKTPSVWWRYVVEEERKHTRTVSTRDAKGRRRTRTETYYEWHEIDRLEDARPHFDLVDRSGAVRVVVKRASITPRQSAQETFREGEKPGFLEKLFTLDNRTGRYRRTETVIAIGDDLYVVGDASLREDLVEPQIAGGSPFIVSTRSEESHRSRLRILVPSLIAAACVFAGVGASPGGAEAVFGALGVVAVLVLSVMLVIVFNRLQLLVQQAARAWSLIDVQLTRRHDLIPRLASVARAATDHERVVLESVQVMRSRLIHDAPDQATVDQADLEAREQTDRITRLLAIIEDYPELKAGESMRELFEQIADSESRIAGTREYYNNAVTILRDRRSTFPGLLVARWADPRRFALFTAKGFERTVPEPQWDFA